MKQKILNYILIVVLLGILTAITIDYLRYDGAHRYLWSAYMRIDQGNQPITFVEGYLTGRGNSLRFPNGEDDKKLIFDSTYGEPGMDKELPPDSIRVKWFSYADDCFYQIHKAVSKQKILDYVRKNNFQSYELILYFRKKGEVRVFVKEDFNSKDSLLVDSYKPEKYNTIWDFGTDRNSAVYLATRKVVTNPEIYIASNSTFKELSTSDLTQQGVHFDSISGRFPITNSRYVKRGFTYFNLELENKKIYHQDSILRINIDYSKPELARILKMLPEETVYVTIHLNAKDSVESVYYRDSKHRVPLHKFKVTYTKDYNYHRSE